MQDECFYTAYSKRFEDQQEQVSLDKFREQADRFKIDKLYPHIVKCNAQSEEFNTWVSELHKKSFTFVKWGAEEHQRQGIITSLILAALLLFLVFFSNFLRLLCHAKFLC